MATNISNLPISSSFQDLVLESGSILQNATGSVINNLTITSSFAISASHATNVPVTASHALTAVSASFATSASYAVSASVEITKEVSSSFADFAGLAYAVSGSDVVGAVASASFSETSSIAVSSSYATNASVADLATTASMADSSSYAVLADDSRDLIIGVKSSQATTILKGQVLHSIGVTGENINVVTASNDNSANMPAIAIAAEDINAGATSTAVISGKIVGINTDGLVAGANVYVDVNGGITGTKPTGSALIQNIGVVGKIDAIDGELVVLGSGRSNDLPNITSGYFWVGDENGVPEAIATSSISVESASFAENSRNADIANLVNIYEQNQNFDYRIVFGISGSGENLYVDQLNQFEYNPSLGKLFNITSVEANSFTGSLLGTASLATNADTASFTISASFADNASSASVATNADSASNADRAVTASIADDIKSGIDVSFNTGSFNLITAQSASIGFLESITGSAKIIGDAFIILNNNLPAERYAGIKVIDTGSTDATASFIWDGDSNDWKYEFSASGDSDSAVVLFGPEATSITDTRYPENNKILKGTGTHHLASSSISDDATTITMGNTTTFSNGASGSFSGSFEGDASALTGITSASYALTASSVQGLVASSSFALTASAVDVFTNTQDFNYPVAFSFAEQPGTIRVASSNNFRFNPNDNALIDLTSVESTNFTGSLLGTASVALIATTAVSASHAESASFYGGSVVSSSFAESSSFAQDARTADSATSASQAVNAATATTASHALSIPGVITNDVEFTGVVSGDVNAITIASSTASIDYNTSNFFTLALPAGGNVHVNATNIKSGTTVNLQITQNSTPATLDFANYIKFESGSEYTVSTGSGNVDLISFVTFDTSNVLAAGINHLV